MDGGGIRTQGGRSTWAAYAVAVVGVAGVTIIRLAMPRDAGGVYLLYAALVMVASRYGGRSAAMLATVLGALAGNYWIAQPQGQFSTSPSALITLFVFAVLADIAMPGEDGFALMNRLKEQTATNIPVAALTAFGPEHRDKILDAGFEMYIGKPIQPPDLAVAVQRLAAREMLH